MAKKPTYEELEQRIKKLEKEVISKAEQIQVSDIKVEWDVKQGTCTFENLPVAMMWVDTTLAGLMSGVQAMVGTERFGLALQSEGRKSVEDDWQLISQFSEFRDGFKVIANIAAVAGWGDWELTSLDENKKKCQFRVKNSWEGRYQKSLGVCWNSGMLAGKMAGYCSKLFETNCWAKQTAFISKGDNFDEFVVAPSERSVEREIENLLVSDEATRADMAVALQKLREEIEDRKRAEEALRESEERYRLLADNVTDVIWARDMNLNLTYISPSVMDQQGYTVEEAMARTLEENWAPDSLNHVREVFAEELQMEKDKQKDLHRSRTIEVEVKCKDGSTIWTEGKMSFLRDKDGEPMGIIGVTRNINERKQAEEALRESESKFRNLFDLSPQAIALTEVKTGKLVDVNHKFCELTKYAKEEILGLSTTEVGFYLEADRIKFLKELQSSGKVNGLEMEFKAKDNSVLHTLMFARIIQIAGVSFILTIFHNVTEQKHLEAQLQQFQKMESIGTLAGGIAHDFNNILGIIIGNAELALDDVPKGNPARFNLEEILTGSSRAKDVIRQLLSFARKTKPEKKPTNIIPIVKESLKLLRSSIPASIEIRQHISKNVDTILADPTQINQVLINLCTNADHAMTDGGIVEVSLKNVELGEDTTAQYPNLNPGRYVNLTISDTGHGMSPEEIDRIFDPYFTTKGVDKGSGMGLAVVHGIVMNHDGAIFVDSELGKGTTFNIFFPITEKEPVPEIQMDEDLPTGKERILFIDDEESMVNVGRYRLERLGYQVETKTSPVEALELFRANPDQFDLVITDMTMPQMTGDHLVEKILKIRPDLPTIICTGFSEKIDEEKAKGIGIRQYIEKPLKRSDLAKLVRKALDNTKEE